MTYNTHGTGISDAIYSIQHWDSLSSDVGEGKLVASTTGRKGLPTRRLLIEPKSEQHMGVQEECSRISSPFLIGLLKSSDT